MRATTAPASKNAEISAAVRAKMNFPTESSLRARRYAGRRSALPTRLTTSQTNATPMPVCARAVPQADPSMPQSKP